MKKLTLSIRDEQKLNWVKTYAKNHKTSVNRIFEDYIDALMAFDKREVVLNSTLESIRQPGKRPSEKEIEKHLTSRRMRKSQKR